MRRLPSATRRRRRPRLVVVVVLAAAGRRGSARAVPRPGRGFDLRASEILRTLARNAHWSAQGTKSLVEEDAVPCSGRAFWSGKAIRLPKPP